MRNVFMAVVVLAAPLLLTACGSTEDNRAVVANPQPGEMVMIPLGSTVRICPTGTTTC